MLAGHIWIHTWGERGERRGEGMERRGGRVGRKRGEGEGERGGREWREEGRERRGK